MAGLTPAQRAQMERESNARIEARKKAKEAGTHKEFKLPSAATRTVKKKVVKKKAVQRTVTPASTPPSTSDTLKKIKDRDKYVQGLKKGGVVRRTKKAVKKKVVKRRAVRKGYGCGGKVKKR